MLVVHPQQEKRIGHFHQMLRMPLLGNISQMALQMWKKSAHSTSILLGLRRTRPKTETKETGPGPDAERDSPKQENGEEQ